MPNCLKIIIADETRNDDLAISSDTELPLEYERIQYLIKLASAMTKKRGTEAKHGHCEPISVKSQLCLK